MPTPLEFNAALSSQKIAVYCEENGCESLIKASLEALLNRLHKRFVSLSRLKHIGSLSDEEEILLSELNVTVPLVGALASKATASPSSVHDLLAQCDMNEESDVISQIAVTVWVNRLQDLLESEAQPLAFFVAMKDLLLDTPVVFCAELYYLIERSVSIDNIIKSGLLHQYFISHSFEMSKVEQVYFFLEKHDRNHEAIRPFLEKIKKIGTSYAGLEKYALDGRLKHEALEQVTIVTPVYSQAIDEASFNKLFQFFGFAFLVAAFQGLPGVSDLCLEKTLTSFSVDDMKQFYCYVHGSVPAEDRQELIVGVSSCFTDEMVLQLLKSEDVPVWSILSSNASLMSKVDIDWFKSKIPSLKVDEIEQAFKLSQTELLKTHQFDCLIYRRIAELKLENPGLFVAATILLKLKANDDVQAWLSNKAEEYRELITYEMNCLSSGSIDDNHQRLCDFMRLTQPSYRALQNMSRIKHDLPLDNHQRDGWILVYLYSLSSTLLSIEHVDGVLAVMQKSYNNYTSEELSIWKGRILLEAVSTPFAKDDLRNFLWEESNGYLALWKQMLNSDNLMRVLAPLSDELFETCLTSILSEVENTVNSGWQLCGVLMCLNKEKQDIFLAAIQGKLSIIINDCSTLLDVLSDIEHTYYMPLLKRIENDLPNIILTVDQLDDVLYMLGNHTSEINHVLEAMNERLPTLCKATSEVRNVSLLAMLKENQSLLFFSERVAGSQKRKLETIDQNFENKKGFFTGVS